MITLNYLIYIYIYIYILTHTDMDQTLQILLKLTKEIQD